MGRILNSLSTRVIGYLEVRAAKRIVRTYEKSRAQGVYSARLYEQSDLIPRQVIDAQLTIALAER